MKKLTWKRGTKIVSFVLSALLITGVFNGCGNKATDKDDQGRTMIYVSPWPANQGKELDAMNEQKNKFESNNPDVVVLGDTWKFDLKNFLPEKLRQGGCLLYTMRILRKPRRLSPQGTHRI